MDTGTQGRADGGPTDHEAHEMRLAAALSDLLREVDVGDYRNQAGQPLGDNAARLRAQAVVDQFKVTHEQVCQTLDDCERAGDFRHGARRLMALSQASPSDTPAEYETWHTGP